MTFDEWFEDYQPIRNIDGDSGPIIYAKKRVSLSDRYGLRFQPVDAGHCTFGGLLQVNRSLRHSRATQPSVRK